VSAWRLAARDLYENGGSGTWSDVPDYKALRALVRLGLATNTGTNRSGKGSPDVWTLTQLGRDYCEGRIAVETARGFKRHKVQATWLASLPKGIRLESRRVTPRHATQEQ